MKKEVFEIFEKLKNKILHFVMKSKKTLILILILIIVDIVLGVISRVFVNDMPEQNATSRWSDKRCAHVSVFFTEDQLIDDNFIKGMEYEFINKIRGDGGVKEEEGNYNSCYSAEGVVDITFEKKPVKDVYTVGVAGDFFMFHPLEFVAGGPFSDESEQKDYIVIDEVLAWNLFGSRDVCGQLVYVGDVPHYISGVFKRKEGVIREAAGPRNTDSIAYISYDSLSKYGTILSGRATEKEISEDGKKAKFGGINCYEVVGPNPVDGLIASNLRESMGLNDRFFLICENSERFKTIPLFTVIGSFGKRSMWTKPIYYPNWENVARGFEDVLALFLLIKVVLKTVVGIMIIVLIKKNFDRREFDLNDFIEKLADKKYELEVKLNDRKRSKRGNS